MNTGIAKVALNGGTLVKVQQGENGKLVPKKKLIQKYIELQSRILDAHDEIKASKAKAKALRKALSLTETGKKLIDLGQKKTSAIKTMLQYETRMQQLLEDAEDMGVDIKSDLKKIKAVEIGD
ncbi:MAG: hypothetical protein HGGPFJEG_03086 [Ignavibacteria bacterium]|nr:hypothetical protein [Ignavibacteria bacterium]